MKVMAICATSLLLSVVTLGQSPGVLPNWRSLGQASSIVLVGTIKNQFDVIDPAKVRKDTDKHLPDGRTVHELQNLTEFGVGQVFRIEATEVLKGHFPGKASQQISLFIPGTHPQEGAPVILENEKYILFLTPLSKEEKRTLAGMHSYRPSINGSAKETRFDTEFTFKIVGGSAGAIALKQQDDLLAKIKESFRKE